MLFGMYQLYCAWYMAPFIKHSNNNIFEISSADPIIRGSAAPGNKDEDVVGEF